MTTIGAKSAVSWPDILNSGVNGRGLVEEANRSKGAIVAGCISEGTV